MTCKHDPWMDRKGELPRTVGGMFGTQALVCKLCGVLYIPVEEQEKIDQQEKAAWERYQARIAEIEAEERKKKGQVPS